MTQSHPVPDGVPTGSDVDAPRVGGHNPLADVQKPLATLVGCSHGTDNLAGRTAIAQILDDVRALRPELDVREAFVDVQQPEVADVVGEVLAEGGSAVVTPLLLSTGFHVKHDIGQAVAGSDDAAAAPPLGPHPLLVDVLVDRLVTVGVGGDDAVLVAAAGSSDPDAATAVREVTDGVRAVLAARGVRPRSLEAAFGAGAQPRVGDAVAAARADGAGRVVVAAYLLAPGFFLDRVHEAGADVVTAPLTPDPRIARVVLERYAEAVSGA